MSSVDAPVSKPAAKGTSPSGVVGLFGLFAGLCAIFGLLVTLSEWHDDTARAAWPEVSALIEQGYVDAVRPRSGSGSSQTWQLRYRVRYEAAGRERHATLTSHTTTSQEDAASMHAWAAQHRRGGRIDVRYDPARPEHAVFASPEVPDTGPRTRTNLLITGIAALACLVLLPLARFMAAREGPDAGVTTQMSPGGRLAVGLALCAAGIGFAAYGLLDPAAPIQPDRFIALPVGIVFASAGVLLAFPGASLKWRSVCGTLLIAGFAVISNWIAFGPGERHFSGSVGGAGIAVSGPVGELTGRIAFGIGAVLLDAVLIFSLVKLFKLFAAPPDARP